MPYPEIVPNLRRPSQGMFNAALLKRINGTRRPVSADPDPVGLPVQPAHLPAARRRRGRTGEAGAHDKAPLRLLLNLFGYILGVRRAIVRLAPKR